MTANDRAAKLGQRIRARRLELDLSQEDLAHRAGVNHGYISKIENGRATRPGANVLSDLARALGYAGADDLLDGLPPVTSPRRDTQWVAGLDALRMAADVLQRGTQPPAPPVDMDGPPTRALRESNVVWRVGLPVFRYAAAGDPTNPEDQPIPDRHEVPPASKLDVIGPRGFGVEVRGTSMVGKGILDGDVVWVAPHLRPRPDQIVVAYVRDCKTPAGSHREDGVVVKLLARRETGDLGLLSFGAGPAERYWLECREHRILGPVVVTTRYQEPNE